MNIFKRIRDRREKKAKECQERHVAWIAKLQAEIDEQEKVMLEKVCPILKEECSANCIHFQHGYVETIRSYSTSSGHCFAYQEKVFSSCKLWT